MLWQSQNYLACIHAYLNDTLCGHEPGLDQLYVKPMFPVFNIYRYFVVLDSPQALGKSGSLFEFHF